VTVDAPSKGVKQSNSHPRRRRAQLWARMEVTGHNTTCLGMYSLTVRQKEAQALNVREAIVSWQQQGRMARRVRLHVLTAVWSKLLDLVFLEFAIQRGWSNR
jgi:hypothetical protein